MLSPAVDRLIALALEEDIGPGDVTTAALIAPSLPGRGELLAKEPMVVAGLEMVGRVLRQLDATVSVFPLCADGDSIPAGTLLARIIGPAAILLSGERTALNFLQRLCGVATHVRAFCRPLAGARALLVDTRKTTPGWRVLEKYAVRVGGATNHRMGLFDGVLIKNNHIAVAGGIRPAVALARRGCHHLARIEVEVEDLAGVAQALEAKVEVIMLDNMTTELVRQAVALIAGRALVEVSGGVTAGRLAELAATEVDLISAGALTHSARSVDISMRIEIDH